MIDVAGDSGEGGGQVLRSALALSMCTGAPFRIENIRAKRKKPGLMRQHLTAVRAATQVCAAQVEGDEIGSTELTFAPGEVRGGRYTFAVGTAGSATLVLQTVLPALMLAPQPSELAVEGGTHNPYAPPFHFLDSAFAPIARRMGVGLDLTLERWGFYPAGGGRIHAAITPTPQLQAVAILERGQILHRTARAVVANLSERVASREIKVIRKMTGSDDGELQAQRIDDSPGPGNVVMLELGCAHITELFSSFGAHGVPSEFVANQAIDQLRRYLAADVPVGEHLADQLLLPMSLAAMQGRRCSFRTLPLSRHAQTQIDLIRQFLDVRISTERDEAKRTHVSVG